MFSIRNRAFLRPISMFLTRSGFNSDFFSTYFYFTKTSWGTTVCGVFEKLAIKSSSSKSISSRFSQKDDGTILTSTIVHPNCFISFRGYFSSSLAIEGKVGGLPKNGGGINNEGGGKSEGGFRPIVAREGGDRSWGTGGKVVWLMFGGGGSYGKMNGLTEIASAADDNRFKSWINLCWTMLFSLDLLAESLLIRSDEFLNPDSSEWGRLNLTPLPGTILSFKTFEQKRSYLLLFSSLSYLSLLKLINWAITA